MSFRLPPTSFARVANVRRTIWQLTRIASLSATGHRGCDGSVMIATGLDWTEEIVPDMASKPVPTSSPCHEESYLPPSSIGKQSTVRVPAQTRDFEGQSETPPVSRFAACGASNAVYRVYTVGKRDTCIEFGFPLIA